MNAHPGLIAVCAVTCALAGGTPAALHGQSDDGAAEAAEFMTAVPENPAFRFLDVAPSKIERPVNLRDLGAAIINGIGSDGLVRQGLAVAASGWNIGGDETARDEYQDSWATRLFLNSRLSLATVKSAGDSASTDASLGVSLRLYDAGDIWADADLSRRLGDAMVECAPDMPPGVESDSSQRDVACIGRAIKNITSELWNADRVSLSFALGAKMLQSQLANTEFSGVSGWLVGSKGVRTWGQIIVQAQYRYQPELGDATEFSMISGGTRMLFGSAMANGFFELVLEDKRGTTDGTDDSSKYWSAGVEARIMKDVWLSTGFGNRFDSLEDPDKVVFLASLKLGVARAGRINKLAGG